MPAQEDIMSLLDRLQYGLDNPDLPKSFVQKPAASDPRAQAIQKYMEMQGAEAAPRMPKPMEMDPRRAGKTRPMGRKAQTEMKGDMYDEAQQDQPGDIGDLNPLFRDDITKKDNYVDAQGRSDPGLAPDQSNMTNDEEEQGRLDAMHLPTYVDRRGKPSPNKEFDTEGELAGINKKIEGIQEFDPAEMEQAQQGLRNSPTDKNVFDFQRKYGKGNLPDFGPMQTDEETQLRRGLEGNQEGLQGMPLDGLRRLFLFKKQQRGEQLTDEEMLQLIEPRMDTDPDAPTQQPPQTYEPQPGLDFIPQQRQDRPGGPTPIIPPNRNRQRPSETDIQLCDYTLRSLVWATF